MTDEETIAFLREGTRTGKLAVVTPSGRPTITPIWFVHEDDGKIRMVTGAGSAKVKALRGYHRACILVDLEEPPYAYVRVDVTAAFDDDPAEVARISTAVGGRYMGERRAKEFGERNSGPGQLAIVFSPIRISAVTDVAE